MKPKVKKIEPFFRSITPRIRVLLYLLGSGQFSIDELRKMPVSVFSELPLLKNLPSSLELDDIVSELKKRPIDSMVFSLDSGRFYSATNVIDILKRAHKIAGKEYMGIDAFVEYVTKT